LFRTFGFAGVGVAVVVVTAGLVDEVVVFGAVGNEAGGVVPVKLLVVGEPDVAGAPVELELPEEGLIVLDDGRVVSGVGTGGNGFERTLAIRSLRPASD
jgi:hypothetical protein